jgi:hypothetical protein
MTYVMAGHLQVRQRKQVRRRMENGKRHGQGTLMCADGDKYVGKLKNRKHHGHGINKRASGSVYVGEWRDGK